MPPVSDDDLILFHYRDGLDAARLAQIATAFASSPELAARYTRLQAMLADVDAVPLPQPDRDFETRLWAGLQARIAPAQVVPITSAPRAVVRRRAPRAAWLALASAAVLVLALGFYAGRNSVNPVSPPVASKEGSGTRVLDAYVAAHLRQTEGLLLTAVNSDSTELRNGDAELAASLVESNRLYAAAATRAGNARLADFLRQLEPLLLELANPAGAPDISIRQGLRDYVRSNDVLFQVRATEARLDARGVHGT